jgi:hypothetical protein
MAGKMKSKIMKGGKNTKKAKVMKKRKGMMIKKGMGKKTDMRGMKVENFKDMMFKKFGGKT